MEKNNVTVKVLRQRYTLYTFEIIFCSEYFFFITLLIFNFQTELACCELEIQKKLQGLKIL